MKCSLKGTDWGGAEVHVSVPDSVIHLRYQKPDKHLHGTGYQGTKRFPLASGNAQQEQECDITLAGVIKAESYEDWIGSLMARLCEHGWSVHVLASSDNIVC